jgi:O-antigen/teichoic acid export membrane protein
MGVSLFVGIYVARFLGPEKFGLLSYTVSFVWLFSSLAAFGLNNILVRELVQSPEQRNKLLGTVFWLKVFGTFVMATAITAVLQFFEEDQQTYWMIVLIALGFLFQTTNVIELCFQAQVQSKFIVLAQVVQLFITSIFKIYLIWIQAELIWFAFALMMDQAVAAALFLIMYHWKIGWFPFFSFNWKRAKKLMGGAWPLIFSGMIVLMYMKIDQVMLKEMLNTKAVGDYAAAVKLCEALYFIPMAIMASLFPVVIEARKESREVYENRFQKIYEMMVWGSLLVAIPISFLADWFIQILYGTNFQEAAVVLKIYIWGFVFVSLGVASSHWLVAENLEKHALVRSFLGAILNICINWYLIPIYGITGAAYATLITQFFVAYIFFGFSKKTRNSFMLSTRALSFRLIK